MPFATMADHRAMWNAQREAQGAPNDDAAWQEFLFERWRAMDALVNSPEVDDFMKAIPLEAAHQVERWGAEHDRRKSAWDWYWTLGFLAGKAAHSMLSGDWFKAKHHCVTVAALALNWHRRVAEMDAGS